MTEEALVRYNTFTHEVGEVAEDWFSSDFSGGEAFRRDPRPWRSCLHVHKVLTFDLNQPFLLKKINILVIFVTWVSEVLTSGGEDIEALLSAEKRENISPSILKQGARSLQTDIQNSWSVMLSNLSYWPPCWPDVASLNCTFFCRKLNSLSGRGQPQSHKSLLMDQLEKREVRKLRTDKNADSFLNKKFFFAPVTR